MRLTILHIINGLGRGGAESMLYKLILYNKTYKKNNLNIILSLTKSNKEDSKRFLTLGAKIYHLNFLNFIYKIICIKLLYKITVIQGWMYHGNLISFFSKFFFPKAKIFFNIRHSLPSFKFENKKNIFSIILNKHLSFFVDKIIYNSSVSKNTHEKLGFSKNGLIIRNGFNFTKNKNNKFSLIKTIFKSPQTFVFGKIARFHKIKGYDILFKACSKLNTNFLLVCIGKNTGSSDFKNLIKHYNLENNIITIDEVYYPEKFLKNFDLLINSSRQESMPNVVGESCINKIFCIASDTGDTNMYISDKRFLFNPGDSQSLLTSINKYLKLKPKEKKNIIENNQINLKKNFSMKDCFEKYVNLYKSNINL